jgi:prepilin-type processing-associated H-X9-DG protein
MRTHRFKAIDVAVISAVVGFVAVPLALAFHLKSVESATAVRCASNLRMIGTAIQLYCNENRGLYPRTSYDQNQAAQPDHPAVWATPYEGTDLGASRDCDPFAKKDKPGFKYRPAPNDITAALYLLMRTQDISSDAFICPATGQTHWDFDGGSNDASYFTNFKGIAALKASLSYSYANPYPSASASLAGYRLNNSLAADFAVAADMNPGSPGLLKLTSKSPADDIRAANSLNHSGSGQNVLFGDGHVEFQGTPLCGIECDNIYTAGKDDKATIVASPLDGNDSVLLPTAADLGIKDFPNRPKNPEPIPLKPAAETRLRNRLLGTWKCKFPMGPDTSAFKVFSVTFTENAVTILDEDKKQVTVPYALMLDKTSDKSVIVLRPGSAQDVLIADIDDDGFLYFRWDDQIWYLAKSHQP